jgi:DNA replication protein DnaC
MLERLMAMRLLGIVDALKAQEQDPASRELSFLERLGMLVDQQWTWRENQALTRLSRIDVLVIDDWAMAPMSEAERRDFWEICEDRYQTRSTILTSQLPVARWHEQIGDPTAAECAGSRCARSGLPSRRTE